MGPKPKGGKAAPKEEWCLCPSSGLLYHQVTANQGIQQNYFEFREMVLHMRNGWRKGARTTQPTLTYLETSSHPGKCKGYN